MSKVYDYNSLCDYVDEKGLSINLGVKPDKKAEADDPQTYTFTLWITGNGKKLGSTSFGKIEARDKAAVRLYGTITEPTKEEE